MTQITLRVCRQRFLMKPAAQQWSQDIQVFPLMSGGEDSPRINLGQRPSLKSPLVWRVSQRADWV